MKKKHRIVTIAIAAITIILSPMTTNAQGSADTPCQMARVINTVPSHSGGKVLTLEDINYGGINYRNLSPENKYTTWWGDKLVRNDVEECYLVDPLTGDEQKLFTLEDINQWAESNDEDRMRHLLNATFPDADNPFVAVTNGKSMMLVDFKDHNVVWKSSFLGQTVNDWNPTSRAMAYVNDDQLFVLDGEGRSHQLTADGSREIVYGQSVHRNEFGIEKGIFWSPDGKRLAFYRMDQTNVSDYPQVDIFNPIAQEVPDKYPMAGCQSHQVIIGIYDLNNDCIVYLKTPRTPGVPSDGDDVTMEELQSSVPVYFSNITWSPDSKRIYLFELNRDQNDCKLVSYDAVTGERLAELYRETSEKYVEPLHPLLFLPWDASKALMQSQRDGYNHLYIIDVKKREEGHTSATTLRQLTNGQWEVADVLGFNSKDRTVIIHSNEESPIQQNIYAVSVKTGKRLRLDNGRGFHYGSLSASGKYLVDHYSEPNLPRAIDIIPLATNKRVKAVNILTAEDPWKDYNVPEYSCGTLKAADGVTDLYYRMVKPIGFDPAKKYPTVVYVYGGPHAHNVDARWHHASRSWETYMAQKGFLLFILDNRGSERRGRIFEQATFRQLGQVEMEDQMQGVRYLQSLPYVDADRIGVHGWSFGGFMTISLMTNYPDVFKVGVAGGPVIDWKWYEVMYGERYMDTPQTNPEGYEKTSLIPRAKDLKGKLQIITGYNDDTVVPQHCLSFLAACIEAGTQPDFFVYPGEPHNMRGHQSVHLHERITQYFEDYLK